MGVTIEFDSVSQRKEIHQIIRETGAEISKSSELLETLYALENGEGRQDGFGYVEKNNPDLSIVRFYMSDDEFEEHLSRLESATVDMLDVEDEKYEKQLESIVKQLNKASEVMGEKVIN